MSNDAANLGVVIVVILEDPVSNKASLNLNSNLGGYIVWVSTEKYFIVVT